jgi:Spx/MgsR family transcriptional regulator
MKKAFKWLDANNISYVFHDYKKQGIDEPALINAIKSHGWDNVINRRGTTWRQLSADVKSSMDDKVALTIAHENPSIIKRPLLVHNDTSYLGFKDDMYQEIFA